MKRITCLIYMLTTISTINSQNIEKKPRINSERKLGSANKSVEFTNQCQGETNNLTKDLMWQPILTNKCISHEPKIPDKELIEKIKSEKTATKLSLHSKSNIHENTALTVTPTIGTNFLGNVNNSNSPMDNSIGVSNSGWIVSVANTTIKYFDANGNNTYINDIPTFFNDNTITNVCDPVVIYDSGADKFIFFAQECSGNSSNSYLLICFSKTSNPNDGWWSYKLTGNPLNNNTWFDYPKLAVSTNELYITGNLFTNGGNFNQAILYQIQKNNGYVGNAINWQYWSNISGTPFTLLPVSYGQSGNYGPGCFIVATSAGGASTIKLYDLTDDMTSSNEQLNYYSVSSSAYSPAGDSPQLGTSCLLDNGDCRALSGFYLNGVIHFVFHSDIGSGWNGINYNRLNPVALTNQTSTFGSVGNFDYSYPSVVSFANSQNDASVMIGFGRSSSNIFPEVRVVNCDNNYNWSSSSLVKSSSSFVSYTSPTKERWGDYTGTSRKHNSSNPSIWMNGMYGTSANVWNTWIAEIHNFQSVDVVEKNRMIGELKVFPNPVVESFSVEFNLESAVSLKIKIIDINGKLIKLLYDGKGISGSNSFTFNKSNLSSGTYFLTIMDDSKTIKNEKIIINN
ncbi:MAG: T9SS type A sorting domain-containing protein [Bacteroidia bacterium]